MFALVDGSPNRTRTYNLPGFKFILTCPMRNFSHPTKRRNALPASSNLPYHRTDEPYPTPFCEQPSRNGLGPHGGGATRGRLYAIPVDEGQKDRMITTFGMREHRPPAAGRPEAVA
ncbi:hypothetical protein GCM10010109_63950 [Actinoplanes campanulatus]|nr:hypothetical protein GCM10010109_63950 [Actinoplanes campanulatus]GID39759.1 hypothetical protein Aca09nite_62650 [Actinoplanes campanulatus]